MKVQSILIISSEYPPGPGGIGRHAADLSLALSNKGYSVDVMTSLDYENKHRINQYIETLPLKIEIFPFKRMGWFTYISRVRVVLNQLKKKSYERIIVTGMFPLWVGAIVKLIFNNKVHVDSFIHGSEVNPGNPILRLLTHGALKKADHIWAVSGFTASLLPVGLINKNKLTLLPNGIHSSDWIRYIHSKPFSNWKGYPKLLTVGNVTLRKGQHRVIQALPALIKNFPNIHYHAVGLPTREKEIIELAENLGVSEHITVHGRLADKEELAMAYKTADVFIMLSENQTDGDVEGFGIAILEANYFGLPAIGAKGCGIEDAIQSGVNGELVDGNNELEITDSLKKILENKTNYTSQLSGWVKKHDWNILIEKFLAKG
jgi:phosphatidylinositol alpha-1,6-mannosyltransferase